MVAIIDVAAAIEPRFHARRVCFLSRVADFFREDHFTEELGCLARPQIGPEQLSSKLSTQLNRLTTRDTRSPRGE